MQLVGIIPACAGSTPYSSCCFFISQDHPRLRGEHFIKISLHQFDSGSSPPARGAPSLALHDFAHHGIIPACAGSTKENKSSFYENKDHPRLRGEHGCLFATLAARSGSSPPARGAPFRLDILPFGARIIPACAGSTYLLICHIHGSQDHPRLRGEHFYRADFYSRRSGSSPPARGAPTTMPFESSMCRIIPACAGSTETSYRCG